MALGRAGANVFHAGKIGKDGEWVRKIMEDAGVDTTYIQVAEKEVHIMTMQTCVFSCLPTSMCNVNHLQELRI